MALYDPDQQQQPPEVKLNAAQRVLLDVSRDPCLYARILNITKEQVLNLARLATHLRALPPGYDRFNMRTYMHADGNFPEPYAIRPHCGSVGCAVGHGPAAGIEPLAHEVWASYAQRVFGSDMVGWSFLFDAEWAGYDNTVRGAAARIVYWLDKGGAYRELRRRSFKDCMPLYAEYLD